MATLSEVLTVIQQAIIAAVVDLPTANVYPGWPQPEQLNIELRNGVTNITVYPAMIGDRRTQVEISEYTTTETPLVTLSAVASATQLQGGTDILPAVGTFTLTGTPADGCNMLLCIGGLYVPYHPDPVLTATDVAAGYAALINADADMSQLVVATSAGAVLTLTAKTVGKPGNAIPFWLRIGGTGQAARKIKRQKAQIQIHVWAANDTDRSTYADTLDAFLSATPFLQAADNTPVRMLYERSHQDDREIALGVYRRILTYSAEYDTLDYVPTYTVLADSVTVGT